MRDLQAFKEMVVADPLFAAEGMDLEEGEKALSSLEEACEDLDRVFASRSLMSRLFMARYPTKRYVIPVAFLRRFLAAERERRIFLGEPNARNAQHLIESWRVSAHALERCLARYEIMHRILYRMERKRDFLFQDMLGNVSTLELIDKTLALIRLNADALLAESVQRALSDTTSWVPKRSSGALEYLEGTISQRHRRLHELERLHSMPFRYSDIIESYGPVNYRLPQFDGIPTPHNFFLYVLRDARRNIRAMKVVVADLYLFLPIGTPQARYGGIGRSSFELLIRRGARYWYQSAANLYASRDQRYWADIATIVDSRRRPQLDREALWVQRSSMLDLLLGAGADDLRGYVDHTRERIAGDAFASHSLLYGLLARSHPSIYYLPFNASVWRIAEQPNFLGMRRASIEERLYVSEESVIRDTTPAELDEILRGGRTRQELREASAKADHRIR